MSQVNSLSTINQALYQMLKNASAEGQSPGAAAPSASEPVPANEDATDTNQPVTGAHRRGHHHGAMFEKLQAAVTSALQAAKADASADPNKVIEAAIAKFFQDNGKPPPRSGASGPVGTTNQAGDTNAASQSVEVDDSTRQTFMELLQSYGVDAQQFRKDFLAAVQDAQRGQVDPSAAFNSFPPGSGIDTTS